MVTIATVRMPFARATAAMTGAAPVPVPPPMPACTARVVDMQALGARCLLRIPGRGCWRQTARLRLCAPVQAAQAQAAASSYACRAHRDEEHVCALQSRLQLHAALLRGALRNARKRG